MKTKILLLLTFVLTLMGCSKTVDIQLAPEVTVFLSAANDQKVQLTQADKAHVELSKWLAKNQDGWYATSGRYPDGVYIVSGSLGIQVTELKVVIYSNIKTEPQAIYVQEIDRDELKEIKSLNKKL